MYSNVTTTTRNKYLQVYIRTSSFVSFETTTLVCWPIMQQLPKSQPPPPPGSENLASFCGIQIWLPQTTPHPNCTLKEHQ